MWIYTSPNSFSNIGRVLPLSIGVRVRRFFGFVLGGVVKQGRVDGTRMYVLNRFERNCRKSMILFHAIWGLWVSAGICICGDQKVLSCAAEVVRGIADRSVASAKSLIVPHGWSLFKLVRRPYTGSFALLQSGFVIIAHCFILTSWMWWQGFKGVENVNVCKCCEERAVDQVWQTKTGGLGSSDRILLIFEDQLPRCYNTLSPLCRGTFALGQAQLVTSSMLKSKRDHVCLDSLWFAIVFNSRRKFK